MKKIIIASTLASLLCVTHAASADSGTLTLGYSQAKIEDFQNIRGVNIKYRHEFFNQPLGIITSFTYMSGDYNDSYTIVNDKFKESLDMTAYTISVGPAYRFNDYFSMYGLIGINVHEADFKGTWSNYQSGGYQDYRLTYNERNVTPNYGVGFQINPTKNLAIDIAYEGSRVKFVGEKYALNGFNVGVGYRF